MSKNKVYSGQSFYNKVVECTGDVENAFEMMLLNKRISTTQPLTIGEVLQVTQITDHDVVDFFNETNKPATLKSKIIQGEDYLLPGMFPFSF